MKKSKPSSVHFVPLTKGKFSLTDVEREIENLTPGSDLFDQKHNQIVDTLNQTITELNKKLENAEELNLIKKKSIQELINYGVTFQSIFIFLFGVLFSAFIGVYVNVGTGGNWDKPAIITTWSTGVGSLIFGILTIFNIIKIQKLKNNL